jgi:hypothetical protein
MIRSNGLHNHERTVKGDRVARSVAFTDIRARNDDAAVRDVSDQHRKFMTAARHGAEADMNSPLVIPAHAAIGVPVSN